LPLTLGDFGILLVLVLLLILENEREIENEDENEGIVTQTQWQRGGRLRGGCMERLLLGDLGLSWRSFRE
jgi:hypothetical protein